MFRQGELVRLRESITLERHNSYQRDRLDTATIFRVTRPYSESSMVRDDNMQRSYIVLNSYLESVEEEDEIEEGKAPRKLGTPPEGDHIAPDDPRLDWLWKDAAKLAVQTGQCGTYDEFCNKLNIPGREREFNVNVEINGMTTSFKQRARSKAEAQRLVEANFKLLASGGATVKTS